VSIEAIVEIVDAELIEDKEYSAMGDTPEGRVKKLLSKLDVWRNENRKSKISVSFKQLSHKFMGQVEKIFKNLPKSLEWRSFYNNDIPLITDICEEIHQISVENQPK